MAHPGFKKNDRDSWSHQRKRTRKRLVLLGAVGAVAAAALAVRNNLSQPHSPETRSGPMAPAQSPKANVEVWDGEKFRYQNPETPDARQDFMYAHRLSGCKARPKGESRLELRVAVDLLCNSPMVMEEVRARETELRVVINWLLSSRPADSIDIPSLRPLMIGKINELLHKGAVQDIRFVDFHIEEREKRKPGA